MSRVTVSERELGGVECMIVGSGPPLVLLPGMAPENGRPVGMMRTIEIQNMALFSNSFTTYWLGRPVGLEPGISIAEITATLAAALHAGFDGSVNVLGISTGGSLAQQLAADHPELVRRLVLVSSGYRLGKHGAATQRAMIRIAQRGRPRQFMAAIAWELVPPWRGRAAAAAFMYVMGLKLYPRARDLRDVRAVLQAEDAFDLSTAPRITSPTLIIVGGKDRFYEPEIARETAGLIPGSHLSVYPNRGHLTVLSDRRAAAEAIEFLSAPK